MSSKLRYASYEQKEKRRGYAVAEHRPDSSYSRRDDDRRHRGDDGYYHRRETDRSGRSNRSDKYGEESFDDRYRGDRSEEYHGEGLECVECTTWNYPEDIECYRCGRPLRDCNGYGTPEEVDEFGRVVKKNAKKQPKWPPCFEENGSKYVFDGRSGMFYETNSDFFYDPNSKLYYGNKQQSYYRFNDATKKYEIVEKTEASTSGELTQAIVEPKNKANGSKITIKLKTKSIGKARKAPTLDAKKPLPEPKVFKKHAVDMSKWTERQAEKRVEGDQEKKVPKTAKGEPICLVCRRKFPNLSKLEYHEKASKLHQENLLQFKKNQPQYVDRAKLRRDIQGSSSSQPEPSPQTLIHTSPVLAQEVSQPAVQQDTLGDHNIGNQMLRKLGWKPEESRNVMDKDWERIEAMASQGRNTTGQSGVGL